MLAFCGVLSIGTAMLSSCSDYEDIAGTWSGNSEVLPNVPDVADASSTITMVFTPDSTGSGRSGEVLMTALVNANQGVAQTNDIVSPYEVSVAATATIKGSYTFEEDEDDDVLIVFDPTSFKIDIDPDGVSYSQNLLDGAQQPMMDSLTTVTINSWRNILGPAVKNQFNSYQKISDIKVNNGIVSCEVGKKDLNFRFTK